MRTALRTAALLAALAFPGSEPADAQQAAPVRAESTFIEVRLRVGKAAAIDSVAAVLSASDIPLADISPGGLVVSSEVVTAARLVTFRATVLGTDSTARVVLTATFRLPGTQPLVSERADRQRGGANGQVWRRMAALADSIAGTVR